MRYEHAYYRTKDKSLDIEFLMLDLGKPLGWRAYVMSDIDYKRVSAQRSDDYRDTHLYLDNGTHRYIDKTKDWPYVCRVDPIYDLDVMRRVAGAWCEITAYYIKHGGSFKDIQVKLQEEGSIMMLFENNYYRTSDYLLDIEFLFVDLGTSTGWRIYILSDIDYKQFSASRSDSITTIHRLTESNSDMLRKINAFQRNKGRTTSDSTPIHYICWKYKIDSLERAREIAKTWSEITAYYIRNGGSFESIQPKLKRKGIIRL